MSNKAFEAMKKTLEEQDPWLAGANLDTRGLPGFQHGPGKEESFIDDRFGGLVLENRQSLRQAIGQLVGSNDAEVNAILERAGIENPNAPSTVYVSEQPFRVSFKDGSWYGKGVFNRELRRFMGNSRDAVLAKIMALAKREAIRELTEEEKLQVIRLAQSGDRLSAIGTYLRFAIGEARAAQYNSPVEMMGDPKLVPIMDECANFCWFHSNPYALDTPAWHDYKKRILAGRPATFQLLDAIWLRYQDHIENAMKTDEQQSEEPAEADPRWMDDLDDAEVNQLMASTKRQYAREVRAGRR
jgi:hypothetical protein